MATVIWNEDRKDGTMKQPHEDVTGGNRHNDPFVSEGNREVIGSLTQRLYSSALIGSTASAVVRTYERMKNPVVGDKVVVLDATYRRDLDAIIKGVGYLLEVRQEWWTTDDQWASELADDVGLTNEDRAVEPAAWYIQYGPNAVDICRWVNCTVLSIERPTDA